MITIGIHGVPDTSGNTMSHDHGVAVMKDGRVLFACELERHTGIKHDGNLGNYLEALTEPWVNKSGLGVRYILVNSFLGTGFRSESGLVSFEENLDLSVEDKIRYIDKNRYLIAHEIAHLGTCLPFYGNYKPNSLLVHIDGGASDSCASAWFYNGREIVHVDHGWHYGIKMAVNNFNDNPLTGRILGLDKREHLSWPGKLMGYAMHGGYDPKLHQYLSEQGWFYDDYQNVDISGSKGFKIARCMQEELELQVYSYIDTFRKKTGAEHLYYSGGAALNIHANSRIESKCCFSNINIPPAPSDCGLALGAAAFLDWQDGMKISPVSPFLNPVPTIRDGEVVIPKRLKVTSDIFEVAVHIAEGKVVGAFFGSPEIGPRALGHRSLLVRPDSVECRRRVSEKMKMREWYRPVAPIMLSHVAIQYLADYKKGSALAKYMLGVWKVKNELADAFRGAVHIDGSVRAQVIDSEDEELRHLFLLLNILYREYDICGLINTSFNRKGAPIVSSWSQAMEQAAEMGVNLIWTDHEYKNQV